MCIRDRCLGLVVKVLPLVRQVRAVVRLAVLRGRAVVVSWAGQLGQTQRQYRVEAMEVEAVLPRASLPEAGRRGE